MIRIICDDEDEMIDMCYWLTPDDQIVHCANCEEVSSHLRSGDVRAFARAVGLDWDSVLYCFYSEFLRDLKDFKLNCYRCIHYWGDVTFEGESVDDIY